MATNITKGLIGKEDISYGSGTFSRATSTGGTQDITKVPSGVEVFNVEDYGAKGDGVTDDTAKIQDAIDAAEVNGGTVFFPVPAVNYQFTSLTVQAHGIQMVGSDPVQCILQCSSTTESAIVVSSKNSTKFKNLVINSTAARTAVATTAYLDTAPEAGKHGILVEGSGHSTTTFRTMIEHCTVDGHPDDGILLYKPELALVSQTSCSSNGRHGIMLNGYEGTGGKGINNLIENCRAANNGSRGFYVRQTIQNTLRHCQALSNGEGVTTNPEQIYLHGGRSTLVENCDCELETQDFTNNPRGITVVGSEHKIVGGFFFKFETPIYLATATSCNIIRPHVTNNGVTAAARVVFIDNASNDNVLDIGPLTAHTNVTQLVNTTTNGTRNILGPENMAGAVPGLVDGDATPAVDSGHRTYQTTNTAPTTITMLDGGSTGQIVTIIIKDANTTIDFTGTSLKGNGGSNWSPTTNDHMTCVFDGTNWYCDVSDNTA